MDHYAPELTTGRNKLSQPFNNSTLVIDDYVRVHNHPHVPRLDA
jgi:hypothetical protein